MKLVKLLEFNKEAGITGVGCCSIAAASQKFSDPDDGAAE